MINELIERMLNGDKRATARLITLVENDEEKAREIVKKIYPYTGNAYIVGITGPPGSGKSTLVDKLIKKARDEGKIVGVIAIDPTSPFTGGALLGDRIRMQGHSTDPGVFIRSMATRGSLGGLAKATNDAIKILDAYGCNVIFVETVGVGQIEVDIVKTADTVVLVTVPGLGDDVQAIKAGLMEIADIFVVNKADKEGADATVFELELMLDLEKEKWEKRGWRPPIVSTVAFTNRGIDQLWEAINKHRDFLLESGEIEKKRKFRVGEEIKAIVSSTIARKIGEMMGNNEISQLIERIANREIDPYSAADLVLEKALGVKV
ncbi:putative periplasmic protein kinase ArgK and related GTPases of G3E family [Thermococcus sp. 2319x1]|uniref:methylmalonyl Co-A mutase-associated GTPase MeaB n=1 Tax=Thermococcus sp. 2319x1 TaxID=1674923 RepID=UPI00073ADC72|nr:methylmalonyl Co-A mutase-associated GTPase MeaB [Thermococcus sp. 2319x1]ALV63240.1 putative periplasmic protein kinase ArgK and related GTPases of G3E family [Thermococcus sp. 2319x1]